MYEKNGTKLLFRRNDCVYVYFFLLFFISYFHWKRGTHSSPLALAPLMLRMELECIVLEIQQNFSAEGHLNGEWYFRKREEKKRTISKWLCSASFRLVVSQSTSLDWNEMWPCLWSMRDIDWAASIGHLFQRNWSHLTRALPLSECFMNEISDSTIPSFSHKSKRKIFRLQTQSHRFRMYFMNLLNVQWHRK